MSQLLDGKVGAMIPHKDSIVIRVEASDRKQWVRASKYAPISKGDRVVVKNEQVRLYSSDGLYQGERIGPGIETAEPTKYWDGENWVPVKVKDL